MSLHQSKRISVPKIESRGKQEATIACFYRGQDTKLSTPHFELYADVRRWYTAGLGTFVNRGKAFLRYDASGPAPFEPKAADLNFHGGNASRMIDEETMNEFVRGNHYAVAAVNSWA